jgi:hypothetical protein
MRLVLRCLGSVLLAFQAADSGAAAAGRHWQISIDRIECETAASRVVLGAKIRYLGPRGLVEAPVSQLVDGNGRAYPPKSLAWRSGSKALAAWLSTGGMRNVVAEEAGELQFRFEVAEGTQDLKLEFGDIQAFPLTRAAGAGLCERLLKPGQLPVVRVSGPARPAGPQGIRVYRGAYPCQPTSRGALRTTEAQYPPYLPEQLLVLGRGYLPNARQIELPMGKAAAQSYAYTGAEELDAIEAVARHALLEDFPRYAGAGYFAFNWGAQAAASGNRIYSIGLYALRACPA